MFYLTSCTSLCEFYEFLFVVSLFSSITSDKDKNSHCISNVTVSCNNIFCNESPVTRHVYVFLWSYLVGVIVIFNVVCPPVPINEDILYHESVIVGIPVLKVQINCRVVPSCPSNLPLTVPWIWKFLGLTLLKIKDNSFLNSYLYLFFK